MRLQFPQELLILGRLVVLVLDVNQMNTPVVAIERLHARDHPAPVSDGGEHAHARDICCLTQLVRSGIVCAAFR